MRKKKELEKRIGAIKPSLFKHVLELQTSQKKTLLVEQTFAPCHNTTKVRNVIN